MDTINHSTSMYSGETENETYANSTTSAASGPYYENIKKEAAIWLDAIIQRQDEKGQIVIADYGTADGVGFLSMIKSLLDFKTDEHLKRMKGIDIMIYLNDQPSNDFNLLIRGITGPATSGLKSGSWLCENISVAVVGRNMYERCLPRNSLDICFSTTALHWLSNKPCDITNGLAHKLASKEEEELFHEQAKQDWHQFLVNRGKELKKGGLCMILCVSFHPDDDELIHFYTQLTRILEHFVDTGMITKEEFINTTLQVYIRKPEDFTHPFDQDDQDIVTLGLRLLSSNRIQHKFTEMINNYFQTDEESKKRYADGVVGYVRPWLRNTLYNGLSKQRSEESRNAICIEFFRFLWGMAYRKEIKVSYAPFQHMIIQKIQES